MTSENKLDLDSKVAKYVIDKYGITKVPPVVLVGEIEKFNAKELEQRENALIFTNVKAPYVDSTTKTVFGKVSTILCKIGFPAKGNIPFGKTSVYLCKREPLPAAKIITFILFSSLLKDQF